MIQRSVRMKCVHDQSAMNSKSIDSFVIEECQSCKGIWFEKGELRKTKDERNPNLNWLDFDVFHPSTDQEISETKLKCPQDQSQLFAVNYGNTQVEIDVCPKCEGIWLDGGELNKIINALENETETKPAQEYIRSTIQEAKEIFGGTEGFISEWQDFSTVFRMLQYLLLVENPGLRDTFEAFNKTNPLK